MATNIQTAVMLKATWDSGTEIVDTTSGSDPDFDLAAGTYTAIAGLWEDFTVAIPGAFTDGMWTVSGNGTPGDLVFTLSTLPSRHSGKIYKFQYSLNSGSSWSDLPAGTTAGIYTASGVTPGTYTGTIMLRMVNSAGNGPDSDVKTATVAAAASNLITNGGLDDASNWTTANAGIAIGGGKATWTSSTGGRIQQVLASGEQPAGSYDWAFDMPDSTTGSIRIGLYQNTTLVTQSVGQNGTGAKSGTLNPASPFNTVRVFPSVTPVTCSADNISLVVTP